MDLQLEYSDSKLDVFQILEAAHSTAFFDKFTPSKQPAPTVLPAKGASPIARSVLLMSSRILSKGISNMKYQAVILLSLQRQLEAYELAHAAQIAAYSSAWTLLKDILESQHLLHLVGRDPVAVLQGLREDANFELSPDHLKMLAGALGWPLPLAADSSVH
ncbi:hypothetical protein E1B28_003184 [Marasmius oreades]|uniref:Uncharacterized protein n=1 Tax=Marasmius oreades TaxID=181124 RepID=A0A9P7UJD8_9AGAR|nr:uncharacterized protein E1B28_003184 [Marasmius oreades]KAG7085637.1 hypothetical protein E1B28_003184 [Marasmius oreades]